MLNRGEPATVFVFIIFATLFGIGAYLGYLVGDTTPTGASVGSIPCEGTSCVVQYVPLIILIIILAYGAYAVIAHFTNVRLRRN